MNYYVGQTAQVSKTITETDVCNFAGICGDFNSLHMDEAAAENSVFGKRIVHGAFISALISTVLGMHLPGDKTIYLSQNLHYRRPVYLEDTVTAKATIQEIFENGNALLETCVFNQSGECVIDGNALVRLPDYNRKN